MNTTNNNQVTDVNDFMNKSQYLGSIPDQLKLILAQCKIKITFWIYWISLVWQSNGWTDDIQQKRNAKAHIINKPMARCTWWVFIEYNTNGASSRQFDALVIMKLSARTLRRTKAERKTVLTIQLNCYFLTC